MDREEYMEYALALASRAAEEGEIPVGCVIADADGNIIGRGRNKREESHDATHHAEIEAIREACGSIGDWRLGGCTIYVTLEPCPINLFEERYGHKPAIYGGVCADSSARLLRDFFKKAR